MSNDDTANTTTATTTTTSRNPIDSAIPESDPLFGTYVEHGRCRVCGATRFINDTKASLVIRPQIIYTCENRLCPGRILDDPYWTPRSFNLGF